MALHRARADGTRIGVLFIDLDGFRTVNDTLGHQAGDQLLRLIATRLEHAVRPGDVVGRLSGDEFAILCERIDTAEDIEAIAAGGAPAAGRHPRRRPASRLPAPA